MSFYFLPSRPHDETLLPVPDDQNRSSLALKRNVERCKDVQIVCEFRAKLRQAEEMISKLAFSLSEIQGMRPRKGAKSKARSNPASVRSIPRR